MRKTLTGIMLLLPLLLPSAENSRQLEQRLQKSSPGLPEFRVYMDMFSVIRSVRTMPGKDLKGVFKISELSAHPRISMIDITGVAVINLAGINAFKELRALRLGADKITGLEKANLPGVVRLDISGTKIRDISWLKNFPGVRILHLPESVTDITPLKGRSFRALSVPGVRDSDDVCRTLGIKVAIRTAHAYRRPGRNTLPPLALQRNKEGKVVSAAFMRFTPPARALEGFPGDLFPEVLMPRGVPPKPEEYPGLRRFSRNAPFKASLFLRDRSTLRKLDLRALRAVEFAGESFPQLEELYLSGAVINLESLKAPKLKVLILENIEGWVPGQSLGRRRIRHGHVSAARPRAQLVRAAANWNLDYLKITLKRDEFDFNSLRNVRFKELNCRYYGKNLDWLKGHPVNALKLFAPAVNGKASAVLGTLPLKKLNIALGDQADLGFLRKLKLHRLVLSGGGSGFSLQMLHKMPLRSLRLRSVFKKADDLRGLRFPALQELILDRIHFTKVNTLGKLSKLENLALENCIFSPAGLNLKEPDLDYVCGNMISKELLKLKRLKHLRIGRIGVFLSKDRIVNYDFPWERLKALKLQSFSLCAERADFCKGFKYLKRLKIDDYSRHGISPEQVHVDHELETLVLTNVRPRPDRAVPERNSFFRRPMIPAPRTEKGIAKKVYMDAPGGFYGIFLR